MNKYELVRIQTLPDREVKEGILMAIGDNEVSIRETNTNVMENIHWKDIIGFWKVMESEIKNQPGDSG